jgi:hypothetical protein
LAGLGIRPLAQMPIDIYVKIITFFKSPHMSKLDHIHSSYGGKCIFLGESPGLGQNPGLLGYKFKIPDRTIDDCKPTEHRAKFKLSKCNSSRKINDRQTAGQTK